MRAAALTRSPASYPPGAGADCRASLGSGASKCIISSCLGGPPLSPSYVWLVLLPIVCTPVEYYIYVGVYLFAREEPADPARRARRVGVWPAPPPRCGAGGAGRVRGVG